MCDSHRRSVAVGFFDGVHRGHRAIIDCADRVVTFANHPLSIIKVEAAPRLIMTVEERVKTIGKPVMLLEFTDALSVMSPEEFLKLANIKQDEIIYCGENWRFGKNGVGDAKWLSAHGYTVKVVPYAEYKGAVISSSRIRASLMRGEIEDVNAMLGRRYSITGVVRPGKGIGKALGYPTINLEVDALLANGVYEVEVDGLKGVANYGVAPTMGNRAWTKPVLEVHLLKAGKVMLPKVEFVRFIRSEKKFASAAELSRQIAIDCDKICLR